MNFNPNHHLGQNQMIDECNHQQNIQKQTNEQLGDQFKIGSLVSSSEMNQKQEIKHDQESSTNLEKNYSKNIQSDISNYEPMNIQLSQCDQKNKQNNNQSLNLDEKLLLKKQKRNQIKWSILCDMNYYFSNKLYKSISASSYNNYSIIPKNDEDRRRFSSIFQEIYQTKNCNATKLKLSTKQSRGIAAVLGMAIGDALGACTEFQNFQKEGLGIVKNGFKDLEAAIMEGKIHPRSGKVGIWTDDASMGLCMADSILLNDFQFNPKHIRYMFVMWLEHGLNNGGRPYSIGLGGNISISMSEFMQQQQDYTEQGNQFNNGNGSLMRLATVPVAYTDDKQKGAMYSALQSKTTHNGLEASECARLMAIIIIQLINRPEGVDGKQLIKQICNKFESKVQSVVFLARAQKQSQQLYENSCKNIKSFKRFNKSLQDRNWNWRDENHTYSPCRFKQQPGYIGSYCMDALAMALHTVWFSSSFLQVVTKNADMGGDCDTVGSIAGQIAGALYGIDDQMLRLYTEMPDFRDQQYQVFLKGYKLINKKKL